MEMLTFPILIVTFLLTLWLTSHIARQLHAPHWKMPVIFIAWILGVLFSFLSLVLLDVIVLEQPITLALQITLPLLFSTLIFVLFTRLSWMSAFTTNIAGLFIGLILSVVAIVVLGMPVDRTFAAGNVLFHNAKAEVLAVITGDAPQLKSLDSFEQSNEIEEELEPTYSTRDFLTPEAKAALDRADKKVYTAPQYRSMSIYNARRAVGMRVRASWKDGTVSTGKLEAVQGGDLIVSLRREEGIAQVPIAMSSLKKLEVFR